MVSCVPEVDNIDEFVDVLMVADHGENLESSAVESVLASVEIQDGKTKLLDVGEDLQCVMVESIVGNVDS